MGNKLTPEQIMANIKKGVFKPHIYLTNLALAFFQTPGNFVAHRIFPIVPVPISTARFYEFSREDLARDNMARKPAFGHVAPAIFGKYDQTYKCEVDQIIAGIDQIASLDFSRTNAPGVIDPRRGKVRFATEQMHIHLDRVWAEKYFNPASWSHLYSGVGTTPVAGQFWYSRNDQ